MPKIQLETRNEETKRRILGTPRNSCKELVVMRVPGN
jgi:hypothetical protein